MTRFKFERMLRNDLNKISTWRRKSLMVSRQNEKQ